MRLISTFFIICLFGKLIDCNNNNDQSKAESTDKASNQASPPKSEDQQIGPESRSQHYGNHYAEASPNLNIHTRNLSPKESAHSNNPNAPLGYIQIHPMLAPFGTHQPDSSPTTSYIRFTRPDKEMASYHAGRRSFGLTNRLKNFMNSLFWKDSSSSVPYMTSGSSYSFALKQPPPFNFRNQANQGSNYATLAQGSQYKPIVFPNYAPADQQSSNINFNKYTSSFNPQYASSSHYSATPVNTYYPANNHPNGQSNYGMEMNQPYLPAVSNSNTNLNANSNSNGLYSSNNGFPPSSYQMAAASNVNAVFANNNQYSANSNAMNSQTDSNSYFNNQQSSAPNESLSKQQAPNYQTSDSSSSSSNVASSLNSNASSNPVSLLNGKQQFASSY